jgi:hypothetical protein
MHNQHSTAEDDVVLMEMRRRVPKVVGAKKLRSACHLNNQIALTESLPVDA